MIDILIGKVNSSLPKNIYLIQSRRLDGIAYKAINGLYVIFSISKEIDNKLWLHVSFSRTGRIPDYSDICRIKEHFIGDDKKAIMVFPKKEEHVNLMPYCLHLWHCIDGDELPDFTRGLRTI
jgi:hypothetical protein